MRIPKRCWLVMLLLWVGNTFGDTLFKDPFEIPQRVTLRVEITPGAKLLTEKGQSSSLTALVLDEGGETVDAPISWRSSDPDTVSVNEFGVISAVGPVGSAHITAQAQSALADVILVTVAHPVAEALLVDDSQIISAPVPVDPESEFGIGYEYLVTLSGMNPPQVNDILVGSGETPLAGRVLEVSTGSTESTIKLSVVPPDELFDELLIDERIRVTEAPIEIDPEILKAFEATRLSDGSLRLSPLPTEAKQAQGTTINQFVDCSTSLTNWQSIFTLNLTDEIILNPSFNMDIRYEDGHLRRLVAQGGLHAVYDFKVRSRASYEGSLTCKFQVGRIPIPVGGWLSVFFSGQIPLGAGFKVSGKVSSTEEAGADLTVTANANFKAGVECLGQCDLVADLTAGVNTAGRFIDPSIDEFASNLQLELSLHAFAYADLKFGNPFLAALQFSALNIKAGPKLSGNFRSLEAQVEDAKYASNFKLDLTGTAGLASDIQSFLRRFNVVIPAVSLFSISLPLSHSPQGTMSINPPTVLAGGGTRLGDTAAFSANLTNSTFLGAYNVEEVRIYWEKPDGTGGTSLQLNRPGCNTFSPTPGQTAFSCETDFLQEHIGFNDFYLFVKGSAFGVEVPFWLEASKNSLASLSVNRVRPVLFMRSLRSQAETFVPFRHSDLEFLDLRDEPGEYVSTTSIASPDGSATCGSTSNIQVGHDGGAQSIQLRVTGTADGELTLCRETYVDIVFWAPEGEVPVSFSASANFSPDGSDDTQQTSNWVIFTYGNDPSARSCAYGGGPPIDPSGCPPGSPTSNSYSGVMTPDQLYRLRAYMHINAATAVLDATVTLGN